MSAPCWLTRICGQNRASSGGTTAWKARSQAASLLLADSATLTADPSAPGPPGWAGSPVKGNNVTGCWCTLIVSTQDRPRTRPAPSRCRARRCHVGDPLGSLSRQPGDRDRDVVVHPEPADMRQDGKVLAKRNVNNGVKLEAEGRARTLSGPSRIRGPLGPLYFPSVVTLPLPNLIELHFQLGNLCRPGFHRAGSYVPDADPGGLGSLTS